MGMTPQHSHHPYILCHFANHAHHKPLYMHLAYSYGLNEQGTQLCSLHSLTHKRRPISAMFSSNKISQHNKLQHSTQTQHCSCTAQFLHTVKTDHICHAQYSNYIAAIHNVTHSPCNAPSDIALKKSHDDYTHQITHGI